MYRTAFHRDLEKITSPVDIEGLKEHVSLLTGMIDLTRAKVKMDDALTLYQHNIKSIEELKDITQQKINDLPKEISRDALNTYQNNAKTILHPFPRLSINLGPLVPPNVIPNKSSTPGGPVQVAPEDPCPEPPSMNTDEGA